MVKLSEVVNRGGLTWYQWHRLDWIDEMLSVYGFINRIHIMRKFDISVPQASADLQTFKNLFPDELRYDKSAKCYRRALQDMGGER